MLSVIFPVHHIQALYALWQNTECCYAKCRYAECRGALKLLDMKLNQAQCSSSKYLIETCGTSFPIRFECFH